MHESESDVAQSYPTLSDPMDCSLPGSSIHGIFQARVLEWGAIAFSNSRAGTRNNDENLMMIRSEAQKAHPRGGWHGRWIRGRRDMKQEERKQPGG